MLRVGCEVSSWFSIKSGFMQGWVLSPFKWIVWMYFVPWSIAKAMEEQAINGEKTLVDLCI